MVNSHSIEYRAATATKVELLDKLIRARILPATKTHHVAVNTIIIIGIPLLLLFIELYTF